MAGVKLTVDITGESAFVFDSDSDTDTQASGSTDSGARSGFERAEAHDADARRPAAPVDAGATLGANTACPGGDTETASGPATGRGTPDPPKREAPVPLPLHSVAAATRTPLVYHRLLGVVADATSSGDSGLSGGLADTIQHWRDTQAGVDAATQASKDAERRRTLPPPRSLRPARLFPPSVQRAQAANTRTLAHPSLDDLSLGTRAGDTNIWSSSGNGMEAGVASTNGTADAAPTDASPLEVSAPPTALAPASAGAATEAVARTPPAQKRRAGPRRSVRFGDVAWREYPRVVGGGSAVPSAGSWSLGLDWSPDDPGAGAGGGAASAGGGALPMSPIARQVSDSALSNASWDSAASAGSVSSVDEFETRRQKELVLRREGVVVDPQTGAAGPARRHGSSSSKAPPPSAHSRRARSGSADSYGSHSSHGSHGSHGSHSDREAGGASDVYATPDEVATLLESIEIDWDKPLETRQFNFRRGFNNPLFGPLKEPERMHLLVHDAEDVSAEDGSSDATATRGGGSRRKDALQAMNSEDAEELALIRQHRDESSGCSCKPVPKMSLMQLKNEIRGRTGRQPKGKKAALVAELLELTGTGPDEKLCQPPPGHMSHDFQKYAHVCECAAAGVECHNDVCACHAAGPGACGNPHGLYQYDRTGVEAYVKKHATAPRRERGLSVDSDGGGGGGGASGSGDGSEPTFAEQAAAKKAAKAAKKQAQKARKHGKRGGTDRQAQVAAAIAEARAAADAADAAAAADAIDDATTADAAAGANAAPGSAEETIAESSGAAEGNDVASSNPYGTYASGTDSDASAEQDESHDGGDGGDSTADGDQQGNGQRNGRGARGGGRGSRGRGRGRGSGRGRGGPGGNSFRSRGRGRGRGRGLGDARPASSNASGDDPGASPAPARGGRGSRAGRLGGSRGGREGGGRGGRGRGRSVERGGGNRSSRGGGGGRGARGDGGGGASLPPKQATNTGNGSAQVPRHRRKRSGTIDVP